MQIKKNIHFRKETLTENVKANIVCSYLSSLKRHTVVFNQLSNQTDDLIYAQGILQNKSAKYKYFRKIGVQIQFTLTQVNKSIDNIIQLQDMD
jgi:hypothetical protein